MSIPKRLLMFDFDGTLADPLAGIVATLNATRAEFGLAVADTETIRPWVGYGSRHLMERALGTQASSVLLYDINHRLAEGEAMDLSHGSSFFPTANVRAVDRVGVLRGCDAIVIAAGASGTKAEPEWQRPCVHAAFVQGRAR